MSESLWFVMTRTCNFDCSYCYQGSHQWTWQKDKGLEKMISDEVIAKALDFALDWTTRELKVIFYGGEPLLQFDKIRKWVPVYQAAFDKAKKRIKFSITTNGSLLNQEVRDFCDEWDIAILMSMDGPPEIHDKQRTYYGQKASWNTIPVDEILAWRDVEIAWQLDPALVPKDHHLDWMIQRGFKRINFNINWLKEWSPQARLDLMEFSRGIARRAMRKEITTNLLGKFNEIILKDDRSTQPCGTGLHMLGLSPEGWLYPSQEMVFTVQEPGKAPGTEAFYRVGNVHNDPVIDAERLADVSTITNDEMRQPEGFDCNNCAARPISFGGCHCRYVGQDGVDPANRYDVMPGWCQSEQAWVTGFSQAALIEKYVGFRTKGKPKQKEPTLSDVMRKMDQMVHRLNNLDIVQIEGVE